MNHFSRFFHSKPFKLATIILGIVFILLAVIVSIDPRPFLQFGYLGVFVYNLFGPGTFLIPTLSRHMNVILLSLVTAAGMALNDSVSWLAGKNGDIVFPRGRRVARIEAAIKKYGPFALFFWAIIPFPYDFIAVIAGILKHPFKRFLIPTFLGRLIRFLLMGFGIVAIWGKVGL